MGARAGSCAVLMSAPLHAKILVVGPQRAGKTVASNCIAKFRDIPSDYYHATVGVRVHEFEHVVPGKSSYSDNMAVSVELWDVSGDHRKYKDCWPAIQKDADGVLFIFDADTELGPKSDVEIWFREFIDPMMRSGLSERQIASCGHSKQAQDKQLHPCATHDRQLPPNVPRMKPFRTCLNYEDGKQMLSAGFNALMTGVIQELKDKQDRLESQIGA